MGDTLPQGWRRIKFGEIIASSVYGTSVSSQNGGNTPIVGMGQLQDGKVILKNLERVPLSDNERQKLSLKRGDLLFNRTNSEALVGKIGIVLEDAEAVFASYLVRFRVKEDSASPDYINFIFNLPKIQKALSRFITKGVSQCNVNPTKLCKELDILLPPLEEQRKLVSLIKFWNETTDQLQSLLERKREYKRALMQRLLTGKLRFPEFANSEWKKHAFKDVFTPYKDVNRDNLDYEVLSVTKDGIVSQSEYFNKEVASEDKSTYLIVKRDALVMSGLNFWMGSIDFQKIRDIGIVSPAYKTFHVNKAMHDLAFLKHFVRSAVMRRVLIDASVQGASIVRRNLDGDMLMSSAILLPDIQEQCKIAAVLSAADREIDQLSQKLDAYKQQKKGLMQQLLTGKKRVKLDHKEAA